jgi:hypothetical protein
VQFVVDEERHYCETIFSDGTVVPAVPHDTESYSQHAVALGYGNDPDSRWRMCRDHELAHTLVAQAFGLPYSPTLWAVAHGSTKHTARTGEMGAEEDLVLAYQRWRLVRGESIWT